MHATVDPTPPKLRALDPNLPMLAAQAAMELDSFKITGEIHFVAIKELLDRLKNSLGTTSGSPTSKPLLDSGTVSLVGRALNSSQWSGDIGTLEQINNGLRDIVQHLERLQTEPTTEPIDKIRDFCVALSECAATYRQAFNDMRPAHPFRR